MKKISLITGAVLLSCFGLVSAENNAVITTIADNYQDNKVLHNEIQAIPSDAAWDNQGDSGVQNGTLEKNSYWVTSTINQVDNKFLMQSIVGITANDKNEVKGGILLPFVNVIDGKPVPPILSCQKCSGDLKNQAIVGLPVISAKMTKYKQYKGKIINPIGGKKYNLVMWVSGNGDELTLNAGGLFIEKADKTWYRIDNDLAHQCFDWFKKQSFAQKQETEDANAIKNFNSYIVMDENPTSGSVSTKLKDLCK